MVRDIKESQADKKTVQSVRKTLDDQKKVIEVELVNQPAEEENEALPIDLPDAPRPGDAIRLKNGSNTGELLEVDGKYATILVNGIKVRTAYKNLVKVQPPAPKKPRITFVTTPEIVVRPVSPKVDIRGLRGDAALAEVSHYLDEARRAGLSQADIIHGKGNGILSRLIHEYLGSRPDIASFDFAPWEQGGPGCTVVKFK
jgi:DNA mismatch repair protein MutS2